MNTQWPLESLISFYKDMLLIRRFEERCLALSQRGLVSGSIHLCIGQEAVAVGAASALRPGDLTVATYRGHGHVLARGTDLYAALAEVLGRHSGLCKGKGGSMHLTDMTHGVLPPNSIVGAALPIAIGAALAQVRRGTDNVALCAFGEGTLNQGAAHEALNLAAIWNLPLIFLCENNQYSEMTPAYQMIKGDSFSARIDGYGIPTRRVDGMDVCAVAECITEAVAHARAGNGSTFVEAETFRFLGHYQADTGSSYRSEEEVAHWRTRDPLLLIQKRMFAMNTDVTELLTSEEEKIIALLDQYETQILNDPFPSPHELEEDLYATV